MPGLGETNINIIWLSSSFWNDHEGPATIKRKKVNIFKNGFARVKKKKSSSVVDKCSRNLVSCLIFFPLNYSYFTHVTDEAVVSVGDQF